MSRTAATKQPWGACTEVPVTEMNNGRQPDPAKQAFYDDVILRLSATDKKSAIRYQFADGKTANSYLNYIRERHKKENGPGQLKASRKTQPDGAVYIYVANA